MADVKADVDEERNIVSDQSEEHCCCTKNIPLLQFAKVRDVKSPLRANAGDAGLDFFLPNDFEETSLELGQSILIKSGIHVNVPEGYALIAFNKSGVATKKGLQVGACVVDNGYELEIHIHLNKVAKGTEDKPNKYDSRRSVCTLSPGEKIVQFILMPVNTVMPEEKPLDILYENSRSTRTGGFGSTGNF